MPEQHIEIDHHSEEISDIITAIPSWILRRGMTIILLVILSLVVLAAFIRYPDIISTKLKVNSLNAPKPIYSRVTGKIIELLIPENSKVKAGQPLGFMESTGSHRDVIRLSHKLKDLRAAMLNFKLLTLDLIPPNSNLGEIQIRYQNFYQEYIRFLSTQNDGYFQNKLHFLEKDLLSIEKLRNQTLIQQKNRKLEYVNAQEQYQAYKKLMAKKVVSNSEFKEEENKYLSSQYPLQQVETDLLNNTVTFANKKKEILELENTVDEQRSKFLQFLNSIINDTDSWISQYVLIAPVSGTIGYAGIIQQNQSLILNQEVFIINPGNTDFFGVIEIPQDFIGKILNGQHALIKVHAYPYEQFGTISGQISYVSEVAYNDSVFMAKVDLKPAQNREIMRRIKLKNGMVADAEIVTQESSLLQRFYRSLIKVLNGKS